MTGTGAVCADTLIDLAPRRPADDHVPAVARQRGIRDAPDTAGRAGRAGRADTVTADHGLAGTSQSWVTAPSVEAYVLHARDAASLAATANRIADLAPSLSDAELHDLACQLGRDGCQPGGHRLGIVASEPEQLAALARDAAKLVASVKPGQLATRPGVFAGNGTRGRVVLLFPGLGIGQDTGNEPAACAPPPLFGLTDPQAVHPAILHASLSGLRWLDRLGVRADAAVGHSLGEISALVWAGCLKEAEATRLVAQRSAVISASGARQSAMVSLATGAATSKALCAGTDLVIAAYNGPSSHVLAGSTACVREVTRRAEQQGIRAVVLDVSHAFHSPAMAGCVAPLRSVLADVAFAPPRRRLVSTVTGREISAGDDIAGLLCAELISPVRFVEALAAAAADADLLCETGPGHALAALAGSGCEVPAISLETRTGDDRGAAQAAAALFAAGAVDSLEPMLAGRAARPVDIWKERIVMSAGPVRGGGGPAADVIPISNGASHAGRAAEATGRPVDPAAMIEPAPPALPALPARPSPPGRFLEDIRLHRPGTELIADSLLALDSDPYLADYRIDGRAMLPAVMGLEAMAQAACALAGRPMLRAEQVSFHTPVVIRPGTEPGTLIRICAKREDERVATVLRSREAGQWVDHCHATFQPGAAESSPDQPAAEGGSQCPAEDSGRTPAAPPIWRTSEPTIEILDSTDLYGSVCFQSGRFRRVAFLPEITSRRCRALVRGGDDQPWFGAHPGPANAPLLLGSPGLNDATLHVLRACFPHRRVLSLGCDAVTVSGRQVRGAVEVRASQRPAAHGAPLRPILAAVNDPDLAALGAARVPQSARSAAAGLPAPDEYVWDVTAVDATGQALVTWTGLRLKDAGPVPGNPPLPPALLGVYLERGATALGLDPALRITVRCEQPQLAAAAAGSSWSPAVAAPSRRPGWVSASSRGQLDELSLRLRAASPAACAWETADQEQAASDQGQDAADPEFEALRQRLRDSLAEPTPTVHARIRTAIECLSTAGRPVGCELTVDGCYDNGWALLHAGDALIACTSVRVIGVACPVAVSIMTGTGMHAAGAA